MSGPEQVVVQEPRAPSRALRGRPWPAAEFASLDFEATGLDFARDTIVSFGVVPVRGNRVEVGESVYELVDPGEVPPSRESVTVHGLRAIDLRGAPTLDEARASLAAALDQRFLLTWFAEVEANFLHKVFGGGVGSWLKRSIDVRRLAIRLDGLRGGPINLEEFTLEQVARRLGVPVASPHHALDDALVTAQLFLVTATGLREFGYLSVKSLLAETKPVRSPTLIRPRTLD